MPSVEQSDEFLNQIAEAAVDEGGDAFTAWGCLHNMINTGEPMPHWAQQYFLDAATAIEVFDPNEDEATDILGVLQIKHSPKIQPRNRKSRVDYDDIYWCISYWMAEKGASGKTLADLFRRYIDESEKEDEEPLDFNTVKSAYHTVRRERVEAMDQERPHYQRPKDANNH